MGALAVSSSRRVFPASTGDLGVEARLSKASILRSEGILLGPVETSGKGHSAPPSAVPKPSLNAGRDLRTQGKHRPCDQSLGINVSPASPVAKVQQKLLPLWVWIPGVRSPERKEHS